MSINNYNQERFRINPECLGPRYGKMLFNKPHYQLNKSQNNNEGIISKIVSGMGIFSGVGIQVSVYSGLNYLSTKFFVDKKVTFVPFLVHAVVRETIFTSFMLTKMGFYSLIGSRNSFEKLKHEKNLSLHSKVRVFVWKNLEKIEDGVALVDKKICHLFKMRSREELRQAEIHSLLNPEYKNPYKTREIIKVGLIQNSREVIKNTTLFLVSAAITTALGFPLLSSFVAYTTRAGLLLPPLLLIASVIQNEFEKRQQLITQD